MIWILIAAAAVLAVGALLWPMLKPPAAAQDRADYDLAVFNDQLKELDRDLERGVLTSAEADAARLEIQRRILAAAKAPRTASGSAPHVPKWAVALVGVAVPALAVVTYLQVGNPRMPSGAGAGGAVASDETHNEEQIETMLAQLAAKVAANPTDPEGVTLLARSYRQLGRFAEAAKAYEQLIKLRPNADTYASYGEVLAAAADGDISKESHDALVKALTLDRNEPRARFYLGLEQAEKNNPQAAIAIWRDLTAAAPQDAPWLGMVREQMAKVAEEAKIPPMTVQPKHPLDFVPGEELAMARMQAAAPGVAPPPEQSADGFSPEQRKMIQGMVDGLAAKLEKNPEDFDGWMMLARSYAVLKNTEGAAKAYEKAIALKPTEIPPKLQYVALIMTVTDPDSLAPLPKALTKTVGDILAIDPKQPEALYLAGLERAKARDAPGAKGYWDTAKQVLPQGAPLALDIDRRLKALE